MERKKKDILKIVKENIIKHKLLQNNDRVVVGVSGGPDSIFLLHVLINLKDELCNKEEIKYEIIVCNLNHMIRKESEEEQQFVSDLCKKANIKFYGMSKDIKQISKELKISEEECGRNVRYEFFYDICKKEKANKVAVAHNAGDNVETVLFNILRGSGMAGISGMKYKNGDIIRPILNIKKEEILEYLKCNNIEYRIDNTNLQELYTRNRIRLNLLPKLEKEYNPNIVDTINRMAENITEDEAFINNYVETVYNNISRKDTNGHVHLNIEKYLEEFLAIRNRLILRAIEGVSNDVKGIERTHVCDINKLLSSHVTGKKFSIGNKFDLVIINKKEAIFRGNNK